jgi:glutamine synthetase
MRFSFGGNTLPVQEPPGAAAHPAGTRSLSLSSQSMLYHDSLFDLSGFRPLELPPEADPAEVFSVLQKRNVRTLRLLFLDVHGAIKHLDVPARRFGEALAGEIMFDGSSIAGFARIEESDMLLKPDPATLRLLPWGGADSLTAVAVCDIHRVEGVPFEGDPRYALKRVLQEVREMGYESRIGVEAKFFLFRRTPEGLPTTIPHDLGEYFDPCPPDLAEPVRRDMVRVLEALGFEIEAAHPEVAPGQHEIDFRYDDALATADRVALFKLAIRYVAHRHNLHASFMPKPIRELNGSGMHVHQSLVREGENAFFDAEADKGLSQVMRFYIGGLLRHARGICAVTNPVINSFKRLVPGHEAPINVAWALQNRSAMIRVPGARGRGTRLELRMPDPAANPYLAIAVQIAAGIDGIRNEIEPGEPINKDIWAMSPRERQRLKIDVLPRYLGEALDVMENSRVARTAIGEHIYAFFVQSKRQEWLDYIAEVHPWEVERYLRM